MPRALAACLLVLLAAPAIAQDRQGRAATSRLPPVEEVQDPVGLLRLAEAMLSAHRNGDAAELLERAESRLLTRSELASAAGRPASGGAIGDLAAARAAVGQRDVAAAQALIASAIRRLEAPAPPAAPATTVLPKTPPAPQLQSVAPLPASKPPPL